MTLTVRVTEDGVETDYPVYSICGTDAPGVHMEPEGGITMNCSIQGTIQLNTGMDADKPAYFSLIGKRVCFVVDVSNVPYGYNFSLYTSSLQSNGTDSVEIDLMEANRHAFHTTMHACGDHHGQGVGYGGEINGGNKMFHDAHETINDPSLLYGPGLLIDTTQPFHAQIDFQASDNILASVDVLLSQNSNTIRQTIVNKSYLTTLSHEMNDTNNTLIISLWSGYMKWLDGGGWEQISPVRATVNNITISTL